MILSYTLKKWKKTGTRTEIETIGDYLAKFDHFKSEIPAELKRVNYKYLEGLVSRMEVIYDEIVVILDVKSITASTV